MKKFVKLKFKDLDVGRNTIILSIVFNIRQDPNTQESVQIEIGE